jgi:hypothetical protein
MQRPEQARGSPGHFVENNYKKLFNHASKPEVFGHAVQIMKVVDEFLESRIATKTDRANLRYYLALDAVCTLAKKSAIRRSIIVGINADTLTTQLLEICLIRVQIIYENLKKTTVPDLVAKGGDFVAELKKQIENRYSPTSHEAPMLWPDMEQKQ